MIITFLLDARGRSTLAPLPLSSIRSPLQLQQTPRAKDVLQSGNFTSLAECPRYAFDNYLR